MGAHLPYHLRPVIHSIITYIGDSRVVVRIQTMKVFQKLLQLATPRNVTSVICDNLNHRSPRVREDCINLITSALLTFPSYEFDLLDLSERVSVCLLDSKRRVRQASLENIATIAQFLGPTKLGPLMSAVGKLEVKLYRKLKFKNLF